MDAGPTRDENAIESSTLRPYIHLFSSDVSSLREGMWMWQLVEGSNVKEVM